MDLPHPLGPYFLLQRKYKKLSFLQECLSDTVIKGIPTLEDLGVTLTTMEAQVPWELRPLRAFAYYDEELNEFAEPAPPKTV